MGMVAVRTHPLCQRPRGQDTVGFNDGALTMNPVRLQWVEPGAFRRQWADDNPDAATFMGIDVAGAHRTAFALGIAVTAIAGGLLATTLPFHPFVGIDYVIVMYAGVVLGGMGSIGGAFWGGMTIGLVQQLSTLILPTQLQNTAIFVVFLLIVFFRPQGFFGRVSERT